MSFTHSFHPDAQNEYEAAVKWYKKRSIQAAENFVTGVDDTITAICNHPDWWRNGYKNYYELGVKRYPYSVIYVIEEKQKNIFITNIFHHKRNLDKKYRTLKSK